MFRALAGVEQIPSGEITSQSEGVWTIDAHGLTTFVSDELAAMLGYQATEMLGRSLLDFVDQGDRERALQHAIDTSRPAPPENAELKYKLISKTQQHIWVTITSHPIIDATPAYVGAIATVRRVNLVPAHSECEHHVQIIDEIIKNRSNAERIAGLLEEMLSRFRVVSISAHEQ